MVKAILFDFDHTLYDREPTIRATAPRLFEKLGDFLKDEITKTAFTEALIRSENAPGGYYFDGYSGVIEELDKLGFWKQKPDFAAYTARFFPSLYPSIKICPDTYATLDALREKGYFVGVVTNGKREIQETKIAHTELHKHIDGLFICEPGDVMKPDPRAFHNALSALGLTAEESVYVGDHPENDIMGGRAAGMLTVWRPYINRYPADIAPPDYTIKNISDILSLDFIK